MSISPWLQEPVIVQLVVQSSVVVKTAEIFPSAILGSRCIWITLHFCNFWLVFKMKNEIRLIWNKCTATLLGLSQSKLSTKLLWQNPFRCLWYIVNGCVVICVRTTFYSVPKMINFPQNCILPQRHVLNAVFHMKIISRLLFWWCSSVGTVTEAHARCPTFNSWRGETSVSHCPPRLCWIVARSSFPEG